jgi:predicted enzyme related to lactoylglutathione lyase
VRLAKQALDIGLVTVDVGMIAFFRDDVGLGEPEVLSSGEGTTQNRFLAGESVLKVNISTVGAPRGTCGYRSVRVNDRRFAGVGDRDLIGPDGVRVLTGWDSSRAPLEVRLQVQDPDRLLEFYQSTFGWTITGDVCAAATTRIVVEAAEVSPDPNPVGWSYLTVQIFDCTAATAKALAHGGTSLMPERELGGIAKYSIIADPCGNRIELSERFNLTGRAV